MAIDSKSCFVEALKTCKSILGLSDFGTVLSDAEAVAMARAKSQGAPLKQGAINNVRGDWFEWLISVGAIEYQFEQQSAGNIGKVLASLPNVASFDCSRLYLPEIAALVTDLKNKTEISSKVSLRSSNPDFVVLKRPNRILPSISWPIDESQIAKIGDFFNQFVDLCKFDEVLAYLSVKSSLRPDRRLQLPHEGSLLKAIYRHIQTRLWENEAPGIKYYAATLDFGEADITALRTVATHSILNVNAKPEAAVDELFKISSGPELRKCLEKILI